VINKWTNINHNKHAKEFLDELSKLNVKEKYIDPYKELAHRIFSCSINEITKEQALDLWSRFIASPRVRKEVGYGPGWPYSQFVLTLWTGDLKAISLTLLTSNVHGDFYPQLSHTLHTPFGEFNLTAEEAEAARALFINRNKFLGIPSLESILEML